MSDNWDHLGGKEVRDGQTTQFSANWERGASSISSDALNSMSSIDSTASDAEAMGKQLLQRYLVKAPNILRMSLRVGMVRMRRSVRSFNPMAHNLVIAEPT